MVSRLARVLTAALVLVPVAVTFAATRENIEIQVVSTKTKTRGSSLDKIFTYTDVIYTKVGEQKVAFSCEQKNFVCPIMESGKTYNAERDGDVIYITMSAPDEKKPFAVKYRQIGTW